MRRRTLLGACAGTLAGAVAGCTELLQTREVATRAPPLVEDRPAAVYVPTHVEGMQMVGMGRDGRRRIALMYSFPHRFWTITGTRTKRVDIQNDDDVHLMATVWDDETGMVLPVGSGVSVAVARDGSPVAERAPWTMLSQNMGFHYGDNYALDGDGTYSATVEVGGMAIRRFGSFGGAFAEPASVTIEFEYSQETRNQLPFHTLEDRQGTRGAIDPMEMGMLPLSFAPPADELPGDRLGQGRSGDASFLAHAVDRGGPYLAVCPRTPHSGFVLPMMALSATVERAGSTVFDDVLPKAIDPALGYHYGASVPALRSGDELTVTVDTPPQVARHEGYETAFVEMDPISMTVS